MSKELILVIVFRNLYRRILFYKFIIAHCAHVVVLMYHHGKHYMRFSNFNEVQMQATFQIGKKSPLGESCCSASISEAAQEVGSTSL